MPQARNLTAQAGGPRLSCFESPKATQLKPILLLGCWLAAAVEHTLTTSVSSSPTSLDSCVVNGTDVESNPIVDGMSRFHGELDYISRRDFAPALSEVGSSVLDA